MLSYVGYRDDEDEDETALLRELEDDDRIDDPLLETQLLPAKHGAKSATQFRAERLHVPSPFPSMRVAHEIPPPPPPSVRRPPLSKPIQVPPMRWPLYSIAEEETNTGSDVRAPIHRVGPIIPPSEVLAARRQPWSIPGTPAAEFIPYPMPPCVTPAPQPLISEVRAVVRMPPRGMSLASVVMLSIVAAVCGIVTMAIVRGDLTEKDARAGLAHAVRAIDAALAH